ncbi:DUF1829 domain-containing protein [Defluviitalea saccharophila]|uniref:DUF1829 domain-containing protein n=1 Tax=Defluviitalea saccharophila TaxID=879970 RepID=A0ABZ2Y5Q5_9FIRM
MPNNTDSYATLYLNWLKENIEEYKINNTAYRITTPFLDRNNDYTEVYLIKQANDDFILTDDGYTINELELSGFSIKSSEKRKNLMINILNSHGVKLGQDNDLFIKCSLSDMPLKKHMLIQCMIKVSDLFMLSRDNVKSIFLEDVQNYLECHNIRYIADVTFNGKSGLSSNYDFAIAKSKKSPERIIKVVNNLDTSYAKSIIFSWNDTLDARKNISVLYAFINDDNKKVSHDALTALKQYEIKTVLWSKRANFVEELAS